MSLFSPAELRLLAAADAVVDALADPQMQTRRNRKRGPVSEASRERKRRRNAEYYQAHKRARLWKGIA